jgi:hypothetical protein
MNKDCKKKSKTNFLVGTIFVLGGCVAFWNLRCQKHIRQLNDDIGVLTPDQLHKIAWATNLVMKGIGAGYYIRSGSDYYKCSLENKK